MTPTPKPQRSAVEEKFVTIAAGFIFIFIMAVVALIVGMLLVGVWTLGGTLIEIIGGKS